MADLHGDNLAKDLAEIVVKALPDLTVEQYKSIMEDLAIYCVARDHKVFSAGVSYGQQLERGEIEPEEEQ